MSDPLRVTRYPLPGDLRDIWDVWEESRKLTGVPGQQPVQSNGWLWGGTRSASAWAGIVPALAAAAPLGQTAGQVGQSLLNRQWQQAAPGLSQLARGFSQGSQQAQQFNQGLHEMHMAFDHYRKAQIEAQFKAVQAQREQANFMLDSHLQDYQHQHNSRGMQAEINSSILAARHQTQSRLIANI
ncbi:MAG: hypothetical protein OXC07_07680 [Kistimonas sp.]|nr:hypothetical protein [Kistimonas sp.]